MRTEAGNGNDRMFIDVPDGDFNSVESEVTAGADGLYIDWCDTIPWWWIEEQLDRMKLEGVT